MNGVIISEEEHVVLILEANREKWVTTSYGGTSIRLLPILENRWAIERIAELRGVSLAS